MRNIKQILILLFCGLVYMAYAQIKPIYNVPGPEVANLGQYKTTPVNYFTGVPDISVPLYTIRIGNYTLPLAANYHISSVKPTTAPGCLGLGWSLMAGGYISRSVRGIYDEKMGKDGKAHGFYGHSGKLKGMTAADFDEHVRNHSEGDDYYELCADEFTFNFCGYSGTFYYNEDGGWTVVSDQEISVEFDSKTGFVDFNEVAKRLGNSCWNNQSSNNRFFSKFTLITPDGCHYEFGGINATEFSIPYYNRDHRDLIATSWMLTKITTIDKRIVTFDYDTNSVMANIKYVPQYSVTYNLPVDKKNCYQIGRKGFTGFLLFGVNLKSITTDNEVISFDYKRDLEYGKSFNVRMPLLSWKDGNAANRLDYFMGLRGDLYPQVVQLLNVKGYGDEPNDMQRSVAVGNALVCKYLQRIIITNKDGKPRMSICFNYNFNKNAKLASIAFLRGLAGLDKDALKDAETSAEDTVVRNIAPKYRFSYNTEVTMPREYGFLGTDSWGYYNGQTISISEYPDFQKSISLEKAMKAETLEGITYPTGGKTLFVFERHESSQMVDNINHDRILPNCELMGGLRIKQITNVDSDGEIANRIRYYYAENKGGESLLHGSGISKGRPCNHITYNLDGGISLEMASQGGFFPEVTNLNSPDVGYSCVIEETLDSLDHSLGYVKYRYTNYGTDINGVPHYDEMCLHSYNVEGNSPIVPFTSHSEERGKLLSKEYYSPDGKLMKKENFKYKLIGDKPFCSATVDVCFFSASLYNYVYATLGWLTKTHTYSYLPVESTTTEYNSGIPYVTRKKQIYKEDKMLQCDSILESDGQWQTSAFQYSKDSPDYKWMVEQHVFSPIVKKETTYGKGKMVEEDVYSSCNGIPYIERKQAWRHQLFVDTKYRVSKVDYYANPVEISQDGRTSVLVWGGLGQRLIARFDNVTFKQINQLLGKDVRTFSREMLPKIDYGPLFRIRRLLPQALSCIYQYGDDLLLQSQTYSNGFTMFFTHTTT